MENDLNNKTSTIRGYVLKRKCEKCGNDVELHMLPYINFTTNPEYYSSTKNLEIFYAECKECGTKCRFTFDTMIVDEKKKWIIYFLNNEGNKEKFKNQIRYFMEVEINKDKNLNLDEFTTRLVFKQNDIVEKMTIFELDLNDRVIEYLKFGIMNSEAIDRSKYDHIYFDSIYNDSLIFVCLSDSSDIEPKVLGLKINLYNNIIDKFGGIDNLKDNEMFNVIDSNWVIDQL